MSDNEDCLCICKWDWMARVHSAVLENCPLHGEEAKRRIREVADKVRADNRTILNRLSKS